MFTTWYRYALLLSLLCAAAPVADAAAGAAAATAAAEAAAAEGEPPSPRVLACFWGLDHASDSTFAGFQKYVLNVFSADLCAAVASQRRTAAAPGTRRCGTWTCMRSR
jgi:hypothetical protein